MLRYLISLFFLVFSTISGTLYAQVQTKDTNNRKEVTPIPQKEKPAYTVKGVITSENIEETLPGAHIYVGEKKQPVTTTDVNGEFILKNIEAGELIITATFVGSRPSSKKYTIRKDTTIGRIQLFPEMLEEVVVVGTPPLITQRGDTTEFNAAAIKISQDAELEDLLKKLPGFEIIDGKLMANGEEVKKLYIDGSEYFMNNPMSALQNLPANIVSKIKMFDDRSEEAKFSGYDDGNKFRSLNIETKNPNQLKMFGNTSIGYNLSDDLDESFKQNSYNLRLSASSFNRKQRFSISGSLGNRSPGTDLPDAQYQGKKGRNKNNNLSFDFLTKLKGENNITGAYSNSGNKSYAASLSQQDYFPTENFESRIYNSESYSWGDGSNHNANVKFEFKLSENDRINFSPSASFGKSNSESLRFGSSIENNDTINITNTHSIQESDNYTVGGNLSWMHRFEKRGRTLTLQSNGNINKQNSDGKQLENNKYLNKENILTDTIRNLLNTSESYAQTLSMSLTYSEPLSEHSRLSLNYNLNYNRDQSDKESMSYADNKFTEVIGIDTALTNKLNNTRFSNRVGINYNYHKEKLNFNGGVSVSISQMKNKYSFLGTTDSIVKNTYVDVGPRFDMGYTLKEHSRININYNGNTRSPSASQLQDILDVSNPLQVRKGNPNLKKTFSQSIGLTYNTSMFSSEKYNYANFRLSFGNTWNRIAEATQFITSDTIINGYEIMRGARFSMPVNLNGTWNINFNGSYSFGIKSLKLRLSPSVMYSYSHTPSIYDNIKNFTNSHNASMTWNLTSNISENLDYSLNSNTSVTFSKNTTTGGSNLFNQSVSSNIKWIFWKGFVLAGDYSFSYYKNNKQNGHSQSNNMLNLSLGKKFLKKKQAEFRFSASDILRQRNIVNYSINDLYANTSYNINAQNYYTLSFSYRFNTMGRQGGRGKDGSNSPRSMDFLNH